MIVGRTKKIIFCAVAILLWSLSGSYGRDFKLCDTVEKVVDIEEIEVVAQRGKYIKDNPAVALIKQLIAKRDSVSPFKNKGEVSFQRYEKVVISLNNFSKFDTVNSLSFLNEYATVNPYTGKVILPLSLRENIYDSKRGADYRFTQDSVLYSTSNGIDDRFSETTVLAFIKDMMPEIELGDDHIYLARRQFVSPLNRRSFDFYKFYLSGDTINYEGSRCVELEFYPFSKNSLALRGKFIVDVDTLSAGAPFIRKAEVSVPPSTDLNWVSFMCLEQTFERDSLGFVYPIKDELIFDLNPLKNIDALSVRRSNTYSHYEYADHGKKVPKRKITTTNVEDDLLQKYTHVEQNEQVANLAKQLRRKPLWFVFEEVLLAVVDGYLQTGKKSYFDIGPIEEFLTGNDVEGTRINVGGMTTPNLCKYVFLDALVGYGFKDKRFKYNASVEWSFIPKKVSYKEFPVHSLRFTYANDIRYFSDNFDRVNTNDFFSWWTRTADEKLTYFELYQLRYMREWKNHFGVNLYARNYTISETPEFSLAPTLGELSNYTMSEAEIRLRYAPGAKLYETRNSRRNLNHYGGEYELSHITGFDGVLGGDYSRNQTMFTGTGYIDIQPLGYLDVYGSVGYEWNTVPYMLLPYPRTNIGYFMGDVSSFSMMMPLEYLYDRYAFLGVDYHMDGLILSRLPLIKYLDWREVFTFRGVVGNLSSRNNPQFNKDLLPLPAGSSPIGRTPYMELGVGIDNIFSIFRIDYVWRITYLDKPNITHGAILFNFDLKF